METLLHNSDTISISVTKGTTFCGEKGMIVVKVETHSYRTHLFSLVKVLKCNLCSDQRLPKRHYELVSLQFIITKIFTKDIHNTSVGQRVTNKIAELLTIIASTCSLVQCANILIKKKTTSLKQICYLYSLFTSFLC